MSKRFTFVVGDIGAANAMVPVMQLLAARGHAVTGLTDSKGLAQSALAKSGVPTNSVATWQEGDRHVASDSLLVVGTSASATGLESECVRQDRVPVVLFSDGYFNHANPVWRDVSVRWWLALDAGHAAAIRGLHRRVGDVLVSGQPAFDDALAMGPRRAAVHTAVRRQLGIADTPLAVWWSTGMGGELAAEDLEMARAIMRYPERPLALACRMHPKLEKTVGPGYVERTLAGLYSAAGTAGAQWVNADAVPGIELCLAADVLVSITCTEDIKSTLIGGPPVVHLLGPRVRAWMEHDLLLDPPHYLPDVAAGNSLAAYSDRDVPAVIGRALDPAVRSVLRSSWIPPRLSATEQTADILERLEP